MGEADEIRSTVSCLEVLLKLLVLTRESKRLLATFSEETLDLGVDLDPFAISPGLPVGMLGGGRGQGALP